MNIWTELGIEPTRDSAVIRRAYAARLKQVHPEDDAPGFQRLRDAYERALAVARGSAAVLPAEPPAPPTTVPAGANGSPDLLQAANQVIAELQKAEPGRREAALGQLLDSPGWEGLDFRVQLQHVLARLLLTRFEELWRLAPSCDEHFGWTQSLRQNRADPLIAELLARCRARLWREHLELTGDPDRRKALQMLRGTVDEPAFLRFALYPDDLAQMRRLIGELFQDPARAHCEVNAPALQWWLDYLKPAQAAPVAQRPEQPKRKRGFNPLWFILPCIVGLNGLFSAARNIPDSLGRIPPPSAVPATTQFMSDWSALTSYRKGAYVKFQGRTWIALRDNTGSIPGLSKDWARD